MDHTPIDIYLGNQALKKEFEPRGLDLSRVWQPSLCVRINCLPFRQIFHLF